MNVEHLVDMANQISRFYAAMPDAPAAQKDLVSHLRRFWDPRMRAEFMGHVDATTAAGLDPFLVEALGVHRELILTGVRVEK